MQSKFTTFGKWIVRAPRRRAFSLVEVVVAASMLAILLTTTVQMVRAISLHQRTSDRREVALEAVRAVADQIANIPWSQLTSESAKQVAIPKPLDGYLPGAKLSVSLDDLATPVPSKRIHVDLAWNGADGQLVAPVRLTSWVFPERSRSE